MRDQSKTIGLRSIFLPGTGFMATEGAETLGLALPPNLGAAEPH